MALCDSLPRPLPRPARLASRSGANGALAEVTLLLLLYAAYSAARMIGGADLPSAVGHARDLLRLEGMLGLDVELAANRALHAVPALALASSYWYALLHYVVTPAVLLWTFRARRSAYQRVRNALVAASAIGLVGFTLLPMAPPRMLPSYVDTLATTSANGWWGGDASAPKGLGFLTNELAAMPSLHVGWTVWVAWVVVRLSGSRPLRALAVTYAAGTTLVVIGTANHYVLDAVAGAVVMVLGVVVSGLSVQVERVVEPRIGQRRPHDDGAIEVEQRHLGTAGARR